MRWVGGIALAVCAVTTASCMSSGGKSNNSGGSSSGGALVSFGCGEIAPTCDETGITLRSPNDAWTAGRYTVAMIVDGVPQQCTMQVADPPAATQGNCSATGTTLSLDPVCPPTPIVCTDAGVCGGMGNIGFANCFPGRFTMGITIGTGFGFGVGDAQPHVVGQLGLNLSLDGNALISETIAPTPITTEPNGADCGTCTNASATLSIAGG